MLKISRIPLTAAF